MKKFYILLGILLSVYILFRLYATLMTAGNQWEKIIEMPTELKKLEKEIQIEVKSNNVNFNEISKNEIKNCEAELGIYIYIYNDSITKSKESIDRYVKSINKRVNDRLINKSCIDSLIIHVSPSIPNGGKRYSFAIK